MARELSMLVGVVAEKRKPASKWAGDYWVPVGVIPAPPALEEGAVMVQDDTMTRYFMGARELTCHAAETEAYVANFNSAAPVLYVVLRRDDEGTHPLPWFVHDVTASPYLAQDYADAAEDVIERIAMPQQIEDAIKEFVERYHVEQEFKKRKRRDHVEERPQFGKEPIFVKRPGGEDDFDE